MCVLLMHSILVSVAGITELGLVSINAKEIISDLHALDSVQDHVIFIKKTHFLFTYQ